jgi:HEAT repeat protein
VQYEPEMDARPAAQRDMANDAAVRVAAAESLGAIGVVKAVPALVEALSDADAAVRRSAHEAIKRITGLDFAYEPDPLIPGSTGKSADEVFKAQVGRRMEGISRWTAWWKETRGTDVLVARFWNFQARFKGGDPLRVYDREPYLRELANQSYSMKDPAAEMARARRACDRFQAGKDLLLKDATDLGPEAIDKYIVRLSGIVSLDERLPAEAKARSRAIVRFFVAETVGKLIELNKASDKPAALRELISAGGTKEMKAGAALALGYLPRDLSGPDDLASLASRGLEDADPEVREAASRSLGRIGTADQGPALAKVASLQMPGRAAEAAQVAALRALAALAPKNEEVVRTCGELAGDESSKRSSSSAVREAACDVLGAIRDPAALSNLWLYRGRRDIARGVREAASRAIAALIAADPATPDAIARWSRRPPRDPSTARAPRWPWATWPSPGRSPRWSGRSSTGIPPRP